MPIRFRCKCGKIVKVEEQYAGRQATCPNCGTQLIVPSASTASDPAALDAKVEAPAQTSQPPPADLQLESEPAAPGGKMDAVEEVMELESEPSAQADQSSDAVEAVEEVAEVEEISPGAEVSEVVELPDDAAAALAHAAPAEAAGERVCPNCGVAAAPNAAVCAECGANLMPEKAPAKKASRLAKAYRSVREHEAFPFFAIIAGVVVLLIVTVVIVHGRKSKKPSVSPGEAIRIAQMSGSRAAAPAPTPPPAAKAPEKAAPPPESRVRWAGFSDPALIERDRLLNIGRELAAFMEKNHQPPATLAEAGASDAESAAYDYVGAEIAALSRFRTMAYDAKPAETYVPSVLFSDGSARQVPAAQVPSVRLRKTESGWVTAADAALLAATAPVIRVTNLRFASLEVALDDKAAGVAPRGGVCNIPAAAGPHQITFSAGGQKETLQVDLKPGIVYTYVHPWQADLAWIPMRQYRTALTAQPVIPPAPASGPGVPPSAPMPRPAPPPSAQTLKTAPPPLTFAIERRENYAVKTLKGPNETVDFLDGDGRTALAADLSSIAAQITREKENLTIEGLPPNRLILVNEIGRMEAGVIRFKGDVTVTFRKTALGALRCEELPNMDPAALSLPEGGQGQAPELQPKALPRWVRKPTAAGRGGRPAPAARNIMRDQPDRQSEPGAPAAAAEAAPPPPQLAFPALTFVLFPDCEALAASLSSAAPAAVELLLQRAQVEPNAPEAAPAAGRGMPPRGPGAERTPNGPPPAGRRVLNDRTDGGARPPPEARGGAAAKTVEVVERPLCAQEIPPPLIYAGLALYGDSSTFRVLAAQFKTPVESPAYPPLLLALARSGGMSALAYLRTASESAPAPAVVALCTIDDPAARGALAEVLANWTPDDVAEAVDEWPVVAGPACRIAFVETLASANPALLDDLVVLNALMKLEPYALERELVARLEADLNPPPPPPPEAAPQPAAAAPPPPKYAHRAPPPRPSNGRRSAGARTAASGAAQTLAARAAAPLSWIALARFKNTAAVTHFVQLLGDRDATKRLRAVSALGEVRDPDIEALLIPLLQEKDVLMRQTAARALTHMPDAAVVAALTAAMDRNLIVSAIVEQAPALAAKAGGDATAALLAKMLTAAAKVKPPVVAPLTDEEGRIRPPPAARPEEADLATAMMVIEAIEHLGLYPAEVKAALEAARDAVDPAVRIKAYQLHEQVIAGADAAERSTSAVAAATQALKDSQSSVRCAGIGLLAAAEPSAALSLLLPALKDPDAGVRAAVLSALPVVADDPRIAAGITASLSDPSPTVVSAAARAAAQRHDPALGAAVLAALNQAGSKSAEPAAASKAGNPGRGIRPADQAGLKTADQSGTLASLAEAAADLHPEGAAGALANLLANPAADVRVAAARALGKLKDATALNSLLNGLQDKDTSVVAAVLGALSESDAPEAVQAVLDALAKPTLPPELRRQILTRLAAHCGDPNSTYGTWAQTGPALKDPDLDILVSMAPAATAAERPGLIALAERYLIEPRLEAKKHAGSILANYPDDEHVRATLLKALEQDDTGIVPAAAEALRRIRDDSMIEVPLLAYYKALCEGAGGAAVSAYVAPVQRPATPPPGSGAAIPGRRARPGDMTAPTAPLPPALPAGLVPAGPQYPGLAKASPEDSALLRAAIIEALGSIGGDHAGKALRTIAELEQKRNSDEMTPNLIAAFESAKAPNSVRDVCQFYVIPAGRYRLDAVAALKRMVSLDSERVKEMLQRLVAGALTPPDVAAAAADALDEIQSAGGA